MNFFFSNTSMATVALTTPVVTRTFAFSITFENSPIQTKHCSGVTNRKQSPLFRDDALGSTSLV